MKNALLLLALAAFLSAGLRAQDDVVHWIDDYDVAVKVAMKEKKDLLIDFTGSDWCGWCKKLDGEVFVHDEFLSVIKKSYILVKLDFPRGEEAKALVPNAERNDELSKKFAIQGFPTILLATSEGELFGRTGYQPGGAESYVTHLGEVATKGREALADAKKLMTDYEAADADGKVVLVDKAITMLGDMQPGAIGSETVVGIASKALDLDPKNEKGLQEKAIRALLKADRADAAMMAKARTLDPKNEKGLLEQVVFAAVRGVRGPDGIPPVLADIEKLAATGKFVDMDVAKILYINATFWNFQVLKDSEKAKAWAKKTVALGDLPPRFQQLIDQVLGQ